MYNQVKLKMILVPILLSIIMAACSNGNSSGNGGNNNVVNQAPAAITIDTAGTVPVIGQTSATSVIYIHNNSTQAISGITYNEETNINSNSASQIFQKALLVLKHTFGIKAVSNNNFLDSSSAALCANIAAGQSCPLVFNTPLLSAATAQGSALVTANYLLAGSAHSFNQVINYVRTDSQVASGALFASGAVIHGFGNKLGYATVYLYGTGINKIYQVNSISVDKPGVTIIQGDISGRKLQSNYVQAVEVSANIGSLINTVRDGYNVTLTAKSSDAGTSFSNSVRLAVPALAQGAILVSSVVPLINSASESTATGSLYVVNAGNESAAISGVTSESGITVTGGCSGNIIPGGSCTVNFTVAQAPGSGNITITYNNGAPGFTSLSQNVTWYNGAPSPLLTMTASVNPLIFNATESATTTIEVTNVGGYNLTNVSIPVPVVLSGSGAANTGALNCPAGSGLLPVGGSCTYTVTMTDATADPNGAVKLGISGNYTESSGLQTYSRVYQLLYVSSPFAPVLTVSPDSATLLTTGNGTSSAVQTLTVSNTGSASATIESSFLSTAPAYLTIESDNCLGSVLNLAESCTLNTRLGPVSTAVQESGVANYRVAYYGGQVLISSPGITTSDINWTVQPNMQDLSLTSVSPSNESSGNGQSGSPYIFSGNQTSSQQITLTYTNEGSNPIQITGINESNSPIAWGLDTSQSSCYTNPTLSPGSGTCTVVFDNNLSANSLAVGGGLGSSYGINLTVPSLVFRDTVAGNTQFIVQPTLPIGQFPAQGIIIYATNQQATVANSVTESAGVASVQNILANASGYPSVTITSQLESYYYGTPVTSSGCSIVSVNGIVTQTCDLTPDGSGNDTEGVSYNIESYAINQVLTTLFSFTSGGLVISMTPLAAQVMLNP